MAVKVVKDESNSDKKPKKTVPKSSSASAPKSKPATPSADAVGTDKKPRAKKDTATSETSASQPDLNVTEIAVSAPAPEVTNTAEAPKKIDDSKNTAPQNKIDPVEPQPVVNTPSTQTSELTPSPVDNHPEAEKASQAVANESAVLSVEAESGVEGNYIHIKGPIIVKDLANKMKLKPFVLIHDLMELNIFSNINAAIDEATARKVCEKHGFEFGVEKRKKVEVQKKEEAPKPVEKVKEVKKIEIIPRSPVVTFMGHVDHGKTSLMDAIRKARVAVGEAGGITQHIGAYSVPVKDHKITFLDTPGHEAFTAMRARGANVTDVVVLVVAADDGIMPQTKEAISHAKAAKVSIIVAINKIDLPSANVMRAKQQLQEHGLVAEEWGGDTLMCEVSATKKIGIDQLLDTIILQSEVLELKSNPDEPAKGNVIEAQVEQGRGPTATVIVRAGTLRLGDCLVIGPHWAKIKALIDDKGKNIKEAGPSTPAKIIGLSGVPEAGAEFTVVANEKIARITSETRETEMRLGKLEAPQKVTFENLFDTLASAQKKVLNLVLKCDVKGSAEAIVASLEKITSDKITLNIMHTAVGPITETDVLLASASNAIVVGFNVKVDQGAAETSKREKVSIKLFNIIYELFQQVEEAMVGMLDPELKDAVVGHAQVKQIFDLSKGGSVAGCVVTDGRIIKSAKARLLRKKLVIYEGYISTLRRFQDNVGEVRSGVECGLRLDHFHEFQAGDIIQCFQIEKVAQKL